MLKSWLKFFRVVNLPTVPGDIWVGAVAYWWSEGVAWDSGIPLFNATIAGVLLYMFGLADNDIVGANTDRGRPVSDGAISMMAARIARAVCLVAAIAVGLAPDPIARMSLSGVWWVVAFGLLLAIVAYNRTKKWDLMGVCRGLNLLCGAAAIHGSPFHMHLEPGAFCWWPIAAVAAIWTVYIAAVTKYSEGEEMDAAKKRRVGFLVGAIVYLQIIALLVFQSGIVVLVGVLLVMMRLMKRLLPEVSAS